MINTFGKIDRLLRSSAYDVLCWRRGLSGWKVRCKEFLVSTQKRPEHLNRDVELRLRTILTHAYETSPYYRILWDSIGFRPSATFKVDEFRKLPFLNKDIIEEKKSSLISKRFRSNELELSYTGGTTGTPTSFYRDHACTVSRVGRQWGVLELCGYRSGMRRALIWGVHSEVPSTGRYKNAKQWFQQFASSQEALCCTVMDEQAMRDYYERLRRFQPEILYGYPNAMTQFGRFIQEQNFEPILVKTIIATAERLTDTQRGFLQRVFGGEVFNLYCTREYGCIGFECELHQGFHIDTESVFIEIIKNGCPVNPGEMGEITVTDLLNYGMPFIRSRTGDMGALSPKPCECGSPLPLLTGLDGRVADLLYRPDGSIVTGVMLVDLFMDMPSIRAAQFVQENIKELDVFLVVTSESSPEVEKEAIRQIREIIGWDMIIRIQRVPEIARNPRSGKFQEVICKIDQHGRLSAARSPV